MATPSELSLEEIRKYLLDNGGSARNHDLVKHFKSFLTDPETRVEARNKFKEYVNTLATIKNEEGEKFLVLKRKYRQSLEELSSPIYSHLGPGSPLATPDLQTPTSPLRDPPPYRPPPPAPLSPTHSIDASSAVSYRSPPEELYATVNKPNKAPPVPVHNSPGPGSPHRHISIFDEASPEVDDPSSPPVPPRRKSQDKLKLENKENLNNEKGKNNQETPIKGTDEDDSASVASQLDGKSREWLVRAAQGEYQALAKLAAEEPRLTRLKDPSSGYTALHWGAKHGDENIVKLIAGTYKEYIKSVNDTTNGGYTALHIAMQFDHENIFNLLVQVYGANQEIRDHSGKKARQYLASQEAAVSQDTFRKIKARKKHTEKDLGFLRIGSLNVRVKRTTEAFSQFLGVASSGNNEKIHKSWGSADNIQENKMMPPPKYAPIKKRRSRRAQDFTPSRHQAASQPSTPLPQAKIVDNSSRMAKRPSSTTAVSPSTPIAPREHDSDSDGACGFDSAWRGSAQL
ncbi:ankyrin repeat domain-containing protein SOWAHB isoform X2 [Fopius arisanus]|uniref:Ankyrin repeat domain-containing protein SOWAHB isoform X2 n=2 Tax=Fopius arisanus TaxID=64838 RepID=A0A9R1TRF7_9HYME|nr:PREDICTED: ankyrin repeat domain-containing protein SOWAHB isoform X2 [Fopius arisanus]